MAKRIIHELVDDLDGSKATETVKFSVDGTQYEIDLNGKNAKKMRDIFAPYAEAGTKLRGDGVPPKQRRRAAATAPIDTKALYATVRLWAANSAYCKLHGITVAERGVIKATTLQAFDSRTKLDAMAQKELDERQKKLEATQQVRNAAAKVAAKPAPPPRKAAARPTPAATFQPEAEPEVEPEAPPVKTNGSTPKLPLPAQKATGSSKSARRRASRPAGGLPGSREWAVSIPS